MIVEMFSRTLLLSAVVGAALLTACGTSTTGPNGGSKAQTSTGAPGNYEHPSAGQPKDAESPALASSSEQQNSNPSPKVPVEGPVKAAPPNNP